MENFYKKLSLSTKGQAGKSTGFASLKYIVLLSVTLLFSFGCKKSEESNRDYGYAKLIIACAGKCQVSQGTNNYLIEGSSATSYVRYQQDYSLDVNITPLEADQKIDLSVYSRRERQVLKTSEVRKANEPWNVKVIVP